MNRIKKKINAHESKILESRVRDFGDCKPCSECEDHGWKNRYHKPEECLNKDKLLKASLKANLIKHEDNADKV